MVVRGSTKVDQNTRTEFNAQHPEYSHQYERTNILGIQISKVHTKLILHSYENIFVFFI